MPLSQPRGPADSVPTAETLSTPRPVPWGGVLARVRASVGARRLVPTSIALVGTDMLCWLALRTSTRRMANATTLVSPIVGRTPAEADITSVARRFIAARARGWELTWRSWELERVPIRGAEKIGHARATGRGLIISHAHLGPLAGWVPLGRLLQPLLATQGDWLTDDPRPGYDGYRVERWRAVYREAGIELIHATGSALRIYKELTRGGAVLLAMDVPGTRRTQFLGKPVDMDDGTAQLAAKTDALILPAAMMPHGRRWEIQIGEPLDTREFTSADELHLALAAIHEQNIMRAPEHMESPPLWLWGQATRDGWYQRS